MRIELLYFDDCPSYGALRVRLERVLAHHGFAEQVELVRVASLEEAEAKRFLGSPTLRIEMVAMSSRARTSGRTSG